MPKIVDIDIEPIIIYMLRQDKSLRETAISYGLSATLVSNRIKKYDGRYKEEIVKHLQKNQYISRKMCGTYHWKAKKERKIKKSLQKC